VNLNDITRIAKNHKAMYWIGMNMITDDVLEMCRRLNALRSVAKEMKMALLDHNLEALERLIAELERN